MSLFSFLNVVMMVLACTSLGAILWALKSAKLYGKLQRSGDPTFIVTGLMLAKAFLYRYLIVGAAIGMVLAAFITQPTV